MYDNLNVRPAEFLRKLKKVAKKRGAELEVASGKGSHHKVRLGDQATILPMHGTEIPTGTLKKILKDLGVKEDEL
jgi:predicted RNA binding protein YcfA (HicA-like mRNA interferase family)